MFLKRSRPPGLNSWPQGSATAATWRLSPLRMVATLPPGLAAYDKLSVDRSLFADYAGRGCTRASALQHKRRARIVGVDDRACHGTRLQPAADGS